MEEVKNTLEVLQVEGTGGSGPRFRRNSRRVGISAEPVDMAKMAASATRVIDKTDKEKQQIRQAVRNNFLFTSLDEDQMKTVVDAMDSKHYKAGEYIIKQGDDGDGFFVLDSGTCECYLVLNGDPAKMVKTYQKGESFGELALMYSTPRAASIKAKTDTDLWEMDRSTFRKVLLFTTARKRAQYEDFLEKVPVFATLDKYEKSKVADALVERKYEEGEFILKEGDTTDTNFYILSEGKAAATKVLDGSSQPVQVMAYETGDFFGELALITNNPRAANVVSRGCKCVMINKNSFTRLLGPCEDIIKRSEVEYDSIVASLSASISRASRYSVSRSH